MSQMRRVLLCGNSLFISGLQASLQAAPELDVKLVDAQPDQIHERIAAWDPEVLILESGLLKSAFSLSLLQDFPRLRLIGLDTEQNRLLVFSGSAFHEPTPQELLQVIEG